MPHRGAKPGPLWREPRRADSRACASARLCPVRSRSLSRWHVRRTRPRSARLRCALAGRRCRPPARGRGDARLRCDVGERQCRPAGQRRALDRAADVRFGVQIEFGASAAVGRSTSQEISSDVTLGWISEIDDEIARGSPSRTGRLKCAVSTPASSQVNQKSSVAPREPAHERRDPSRVE